MLKTAVHDMVQGVWVLDAQRTAHRGQATRWRARCQSPN
jgi:hypothetical protein